MTKLIKVLSSGMACFLLAYATVITPYCSFFLIYQPKAPACLIKE